MKRGIIQKVLAFPFGARQRALTRNRRPLSLFEFTEAIASAGGDPQAAPLIHEKLQDWIYQEDFTPYPDDSLGLVFGIAEEELDEDLIIDLFLQLDVPIPAEDEMMSLGPIDTAVDVARLVALARSSSERNAGQA